MDYRIAYMNVQS